MLKAQRFRSQEKNRADALARLQELIAGITVTQKKRRPTRPSKSAKRKRMDSKTRRGKLKSLRGRIEDACAYMNYTPDRLIKTLPEVKQVFGKIGRAETATDPAPLTMIETLIMLKPREQRRPGMTVEKLKQELDRTRQLFEVIKHQQHFPITQKIEQGVARRDSPGEGHI